MTKMHFEALAKALAEARPLPEGAWKYAEVDPPVEGGAAAKARTWLLGGEAAWRIAVRAVAKVCAQFNPQFDRERFYEAAGYDEERDNE